MRQYWINFKGKQEGPMSLEQIREMGADATAYVWHSGLPDWVKITAVPELNEMLGETVPDLPQEAPAIHAEAPEIPEAPEAHAELPELPTEDPISPTEPVQPMEPTRLQESEAPIAPAAGEVPPCPPTNLVWAIILTILCCTPFGIAAIVLAVMTKRKYQEGDYAKAQKLSDWGAWMCIASIILGLIFTPISCATQIAQMGL